MELEYHNLLDTCEDAPSCASEKFSRFAEISTKDRRVLTKLEENPQEAKSGEKIITQNIELRDFI